MLIRCGKCGKMYDYDKCNGICPKCSRYNRPDSREDMEQSLHDKYDAEANPRQHDWYRAGAGDAGRADRHTSYQESFSYQNDSGNRRTETHKKGKAPVAVIVIVIIAVVAAVVIGAGASLFSVIRNGIRDQIADGWDTDYDDWAQEEEESEPAFQNRIYVKYAWSDYVGPNMSEINWDAYYVNVSATECEELEQLTAPEGYVYYIVSMEIQNNLSDTYDLSEVSEEDLSVWSEDEDGAETYYTVDKVFEISYPETESDDSNYVDFLIAVPYDLENLYGSCMLNGNEEGFDCYLYPDDESL